MSNKKARSSFSIKKLMTYIIFGLICFIFVFVGFGGGQMVTTGGSAAVVNGAVISMADYRKSVSRKERQYNMFYKDMPPAKRREQSKSLRQSSLEELIRNELRSQLAEDLGLMVLDEEVLDYIVQIEIFQEEGNFQVDRYEQLLKNNGYNPKDFEDKVRKELLSSKLSQAFVQALQLSQWESQRKSELRNAQMNLKYLAFDHQKLKDNYQLSPLQLENFLKDSSEEVQEYYNTHDSEFMSEEQVKARHVLIKTAQKDKEAEAKALEKITAIKQRAQNEDFGQLAFKFSEDPGSQPKNGDLGYFSRGQMVPEFEKVAFSAAIGSVSEPVKTPFGYHLIKVEDKKEAQKQSFDSVKETIARKLLSEKAIKEVIEGLHQKLTPQGSKNPSEEGSKEASEDVKIVEKPETSKGSDSLSIHQFIDRFVKDYSLKWEETGEFSISSKHIPKIGDGDRLYEALFRQSDLSSGKLLRELIEINGNYHIIELVKMELKDEKEEESDFQRFQNRSYFSRYRGEQALELWLDQWQETARIRRNSDILGN